MARYLLSRLIPSHKDTIDRQQALFPELARMTAKEYDELLIRMPPSDEQTLHEYIADVVRRAQE